MYSKNELLGLCKMVSLTLSPNDSSLSKRCSWQVSAEDDYFTAEESFDEDEEDPQSLSRTSKLICERSRTRAWTKHRSRSSRTFDSELSMQSSMDAGERICVLVVRIWPEKTGQTTSRPNACCHREFRTAPRRSRREPGAIGHPLSCPPFHVQWVAYSARTPRARRALCWSMRRN